MALGGGSGMRGGGGLLITLALSAVLLLVLVSDVGARQDSTAVGAGEFYLRGNANVATQEVETVHVSEQGPVERQLAESEMQYMLEGRELSDYGSNPACANPKHDPSIRCP